MDVGLETILQFEILLALGLEGMGVPAEPSPCPWDAFGRCRAAWGLNRTFRPLFLNTPVLREAKTIINYESLTILFSGPSFLVRDLLELLSDTSLLYRDVIRQNLDVFRTLPRFVLYQVWLLLTACVLRPTLQLTVCRNILELHRLCYRTYQHQHSHLL